MFDLPDVDLARLHLDLAKQRLAQARHQGASGMEVREFETRLRNAERRLAKALSVLAAH